MKHSISQGQQRKSFPTVAQILEELESDLRVSDIEKKEEKAPSGKEVILLILAQAADDHKFLARLAEDPGEVLKEYDLTMEERAALASGDIRRIESWVGKLDKRMSTWITCRLQQEKW
ncbi:Os1348 family NHLP clan protein [Chloroflexota bacterium]